MTDVELWRRPGTGRADLEVAAGRPDPDERLSAATADLILEGVPENTRKTYMIQWKLYVNWCGETGRQHLPATEQTIAEWIAANWHMKGRYGRPRSPASVRLSLAVISVAHKNALRPERDQSGRQLRGYVSPTGTEMVHRALKGYTRRWLQAGHRPDKAHAVTPEELAAMMAVLNPDSPRDVLYGVALTMTFDAGFRRSELVALNWEDVEIQVRDEDRLADADYGSNELFPDDDHLLVHVAMSKTDQSGRGDEVSLYAHPAESASTCPVRALLRWRDLLRAVDMTLTGPLARTVWAPGREPADGRAKGGTVTTRRLPGEALERILLKAAARARLYQNPERRVHLTPHGLRRGAVSLASEEGADTAAVYAHFRFSPRSPVGLGYMEHIRKRTHNPIRRAYRRRRLAAARGDAEE